MEYPVYTNFIANKKRQTTTSVNNVDDNYNRLVSQNITGFHNEIQHENGLTVGVIIFPTYGNRTQVYSVNLISANTKTNDGQVSDELSVITYDYLGD